MRKRPEDLTEDDLHDIVNDNYEDLLCFSIEKTACGTERAGTTWECVFEYGFPDFSCEYWTFEYVRSSNAGIVFYGKPYRVMPKEIVTTIYVPFGG